MRVIALCLLLTSTYLYAAASSPITAAAVSFEVRDPKTKELYFTGSEKISQDGKSIQRETLYFDAAQKELRKESLLFDAGSLRTIRYESSNSLTGEESKVRATESAGLEIQYRPSFEGKTDKSLVKSDRQVYLANVARELILQNWNALLAGKAVAFELLFPARMEALPFQLVRRQTLTVDNEVREVFTLMPQNVLIRTLAPHLEFQFSKDKKIRQGIFPSVLPIKGVKDRVVVVFFKS